MSLYARIAALLVIVLAIAGAWWKFDRMLAAADERGYMRRAAEDKAAAEAQTKRNQDLQRAAEKRYVLDAGTREEFIVTTIKEVHHAAAPLATCAVPEPVRVRINAAARCALSDTASGCGADDAVPVSK